MTNRPVLRISSNQHWSSSGRGHENTHRQNKTKQTKQSDCSCWILKTKKTLYMFTVKRESFQSHPHSVDDDNDDDKDEFCNLNKHTHHPHPHTYTSGTHNSWQYHSSSQLMTDGGGSRLLLALGITLAESW